jgi:serine/threonine protein phosphatase PrpC
VVITQDVVVRIQSLTGQLRSELSDIPLASGLTNPGIEAADWEVLSRYWNALVQIQELQTASLEDQTMPGDAENELLAVQLPETDLHSEIGSSDGRLDATMTGEGIKESPASSALKPMSFAEQILKLGPLPQNSESSGIVSPLEDATSAADKSEMVSNNPLQETVSPSATEDITPSEPFPASASHTSSAAASESVDMPMPVKASTKHESRREVLPNTMVGKSFSVEPNFSVEGDYELTSVLADPQVEAIGLEFDILSGVLSGLPKIPGDFDVVLTGTLVSPSDKIIIEWTGVLTINPDPKSLWKDHPSDENDKYWKDDTAKALERAGSHILLAASKRGRSHAHEGRFRDDDFAMTFLPESEWSILTVADGAGSAPYSRKGSQIAVQTVANELVDSIRKELNPEIEKWAQLIKEGHVAGTEELKLALYATLVQAFFHSNRAIMREAEAQGVPPKQFSTTLITVIHRKTKVGHFIAGFGIGDGGAAVFDLESNTLAPLTTADNGEYAGQTRFLAESEFADPNLTMARLQFCVVDRFTAIVAMTDGVTDPKFPTDSHFADVETWKSFWNEDLTKAVQITSENDKAPDQLLSWLDFWSPGNHDDRTIAILA